MAYHKVKGEMVPITWSIMDHFKKFKKYHVCRAYTVWKNENKKKFKERKEIPVDEELHLIVEDTHEPIVTPEEFKKVQEIIESKKNGATCNETCKTHIQWFDQM